MAKRQNIKKTTIEKYKRVIDEYLVNGGNGTRAYQKEYPDSSEETAANNFREILRINEISEYYQAKLAEQKAAREKAFQDKIASEAEIRSYLSRTARGNVMIGGDVEMPGGAPLDEQTKAQKVLADLFLKDRALEDKFELKAYKLAIIQMQDCLKFLLGQIPQDVKQKIFQHPQAAQYFDLPSSDSGDTSPRIYLEAT